MSEPLLTIDGSLGEGGGQILRSSLALSLVTSTPFRMMNIRARRERPGLLRQHLTAVNAAAEVGRAELRGAAPRSRELTFRPGAVEPGDYHFSVGTAGSAILVLQTVLPALLIAGGPSSVRLEGGTHNPHAPSFDFLDRSFLPLLRRTGHRVHAVLDRFGFYPAGGGRVEVHVEPSADLAPVELLERGKVRRRLARALVAHLDRSIGERELKVVQKKMSWGSKDLRVEEVTDSNGPGNVLSREVECEHVTGVFTGFGKLGVPAERVAAGAVRELRRYLASDVPVGKHLADQLLLPLALAGGGRFRTLEPSSHTTTNIEVLRMFLDLDVQLTERRRDDWLVEVRR